MEIARNIGTLDSGSTQTSARDIPRITIEHEAYSKLNRQATLHNESSSQITLTNPLSESLTGSPPSLTDGEESQSDSSSAEDSEPSRFTRTLLRRRLEECEERFNRQLERLYKLQEGPSNWSGTEKGNDVNWDDIKSEKVKERLLDRSKFLGRGGFATVHKVKCRNISMAKKSILAQSDYDVAKVRSEIATIVKLVHHDHHHFTKLVGYYRTTDLHNGDSYHILTFPVADCDMEKYLRDIIAARAAGFPYDRLETQNILKAAAIIDIPETSVAPSEMSASIRNFLNRTMGCMADAVMWMPSTDVGIAHQDLKTQNILLRNGRLYVTDFGLSRDRLGADRTYTESHLGKSPGYVAPEFEDSFAEYSPYRADIYSLGCIYLHLITAIYGTTSPQKCSKVLMADHDKRERKIKSYISQFAPVSSQPCGEPSQPGSLRPPRKLINMIEDMLKDDDKKRPQIATVNKTLRKLAEGGAVYHSQCCSQQEAVPSDEYTLIPRDDGRGELLGGMELRIDRFQADRPAWSPHSFRTTSSRPMGPGEIPYGFGLGEARGEMSENQLKPALFGYSKLGDEMKRLSLLSRQRQEQKQASSSSRLHTQAHTHVAAHVSEPVPNVVGSSAIQADNSDQAPENTNLPNSNSEDSDSGEESNSENDGENVENEGSIANNSEAQIDSPFRMHGSATF